MFWVVKIMGGRQAEIIRELKQSDRVTVAELRERLDTSEVTIRRDLPNWRPWVCCAGCVAVRSARCCVVTNCPLRCGNSNIGEAKRRIAAVGGRVDHRR